MIDQRFGVMHVAIAILGLAGGTIALAQDDDAETPGVARSSEIGRWQMFSPAGEGVMSSLPFLYDTATGRVWRFFTQCGGDPEDANGCLTEIPAYPPTFDVATVIEAMSQAMLEAIQDADDSGTNAE